MSNVDLDISGEQPSDGQSQISGAYIPPAQVKEDLRGLNVSCSNYLQFLIRCARVFFQSRN